MTDYAAAARKFREEHGYSPSDEQLASWTAPTPARTQLDGSAIIGDTLGVNRDGDGRPVGLWFLPDTVDPEGYVMLTAEQFAYLREQLDAAYWFADDQLSLDTEVSD